MVRNARRVPTEAQLNADLLCCLFRNKRGRAEGGRPHRVQHQRGRPQSPPTLSGWRWHRQAIRDNDHDLSYDCRTEKLRANLYRQRVACKNKQKCGLVIGCTSHDSALSLFHLWGCKTNTPPLATQFTGTSLPCFEEAVLVHFGCCLHAGKIFHTTVRYREDIVPEAILRAIVSFDKQRGESARSWLLAIIRNCFLTWYARDRKHSATSGIDNLFQLNVKLALEPRDPETPESVLIEHEGCDAVRAVLEQMPGHSREILVLRDIQDLSYQEIAVILGVPIGTVMSRLARARKLFTRGVGAFK